MKKRQVIIPKSATIKCPSCGKGTRIKLDCEKFLGNLECKKCKTMIQTPPAHCCIVCAFSKQKCPQSLVLEAKMKNLEIKRETKDEEKSEKIRIEPGKPLFLIDKNITDSNKLE